ISREKNRDCSGCPDFVDRVKRVRAYCVREGDQTCGSPIDGKIDDSAALVLKSPGSAPHGRRKRNPVFREKLGISCENLSSPCKSIYAASGNHPEFLRGCRRFADFERCRLILPVITSDDRFSQRMLRIHLGRSSGGVEVMVCQLRKKALYSSYLRSPEGQSAGFVKGDTLYGSQPFQRAAFTDK